MDVKKLLRFASAFGFFAWISIPSFAAEALEYEIKATYLYNFAKFTNWPANQLPTGASLLICVLGEDPFKGSLINLTRGKSIERHPLVVRFIESPESMQGCHILFVSASEILRYLKFHAGLPLQNTLIVGETPEILEAGGQIQFFTEESKVRFEVSLPAIHKAGLKIDARVLNIAKVLK